MAVGTTNTNNSYTGDGVTTTFPFTFDLQMASDLQVSVADTIQIGNYLVNINIADVGGSVVFNTAPASGLNVFLNRVIPLLQSVTFETEGSIPEITLSNVLDRNVMMAQQLAAADDLGLSFPANLPATFASALPNKPL